MLPVTTEVWGEIPEQICLLALLQNDFSGMKFCCCYTSRNRMKKHSLINYLTRDIFLHFQQAFFVVLFFRHLYIPKDDFQVCSHSTLWSCCAKQDRAESPWYKLLSQSAQASTQKYPMITFLSHQIYTTSWGQILHVSKGQSLVCSLPQFWLCKQDIIFSGTEEQFN